MKTNHFVKWLHGSTSAVLAFLIVAGAALPVRATAATGDFNVQVSPSPLVVTLKPGESKIATVTVRNLSSHSETLYPSLKGFDITGDSKDIKIKDNPPADLENWVHFTQSSLTLPAGASKALEITYDTPADAGFHYSLAVMLSRKPNAVSPGSLQLEGGVAIFNLVNIDRPGAVSKLTIERMSTSQSIYEFLPVTIDVTVKNTGNVISQPSGTLFMQRSFDSEEPLATIDLNAAEGYILPGKSRTFSLEWANGFPRHTTTKTTDNAEPTKKLSWDWRQINELRMGRYTAKAVMVYNDGQRSTPVTSSIRFWVMPWRLIAGAVVLLGLLGLGLAASGWLGFKAAKKVQLRKRGHGKK